MRQWIFAVRWLIPLCVLGWLLWRITPDQWEQLQSHPVNYGLLTVALIVALVGMTISFLRWQVLVSCQGIQLSVVEACRLCAIGFLCSFLSAGSMGGDVVKAVFLGRRNVGKRLEAFASILVDRVLGLYALSLLVAFSLIARPVSFSFDRSDNQVGFQQFAWMAIAVAVIGTLGIVLLLVSQRPMHWMTQKTRSVPMIGTVLQRVVSQFGYFQMQPFSVLRALLMSLVAQGLMVVSIFLIAVSLYGEVSTPTLLQHYVIVPVGLLAAALPISPAGLGVFEVALDWMYGVFNANPTVSGALVGLVFELVKITMACIGAVFYLAARSEVSIAISGGADSIAESTGQG